MVMTHDHRVVVSSKKRKFSWQPDNSASGQKGFRHESLPFVKEEVHSIAKDLGTSW